ncbi:MAG: succinyl-diaminopimelate desuccinylase [Propionibacteriaceae bacterium]|jgi:succinyl-diaminopimelate desuccinylase|nr:succinyl-diaminopimelate desuccinylase [Propionibacteriaceae bacterium]
MEKLRTGDWASFLVDIVDQESVSGDEETLATSVEVTLREQAPWLGVTRIGNTVVARTELGRAQRVIIAGHLDTVPVEDNLPARVSGTGEAAIVWGRGTVDMKGGVAVMLRLAGELRDATKDVTLVFYDNEEVAWDANGLGRAMLSNPELFDADFAVLMEPTSSRIEGGCQGTIRVDVTTRGTSAHSARSWLGHNAIHDMADVIERVRAFEPRTVAVEGLTYREGLNVTTIHGGVAGNVIPNACTAQINYRFAPDRTLDEAVAVLSSLFAGYDMEILDRSPAARPGLDTPLAQSLVACVGGEPGAKYGWTDVARFSSLHIPAVNYGPGDANLAHTKDEHCAVSELDTCFTVLRDWLTA